MVYFEIDTMCNLNCKHCYNKSGYKHSYMQFDDFKNIIDFFLNNEELSVILAGGEPLVHPQIKQFLEYLNQPCNKRSGVVVVTNGILAKDILTPYLLQDKPFTIQISLDGATEETNSYIRGPGHFDKVVSYMKFLSKQGYRYGMTRMTINNVNYKDIENFFYLNLEYGFFPTFSFVVRSGNADENWDKLNISYSDRLRSIETINRLYEKNKAQFENVGNFQEMRKVNIQPTQKCSLTDPDAFVRPLIKVNGDMQPCQRLYDEIYSMGNVISSPIQQVFSFENEQLIALRQILQNRAQLMKANLCKTCVIKESCACGCPGRAVDHCGTIMGLDSDCKLRVQKYIENNLVHLFER